MGSKFAFQKHLDTEQTRTFNNFYKFPMFVQTWIFNAPRVTRGVDEFKSYLSDREIPATYKLHLILAMAQ